MAKKSKDEIEEFGADIETEDFGLDALAGETEVSVELTEAEKKKLEAEAKKEVAAAIKAAKVKEFKASLKKTIHAAAMFANGKDDSGEDLDTVTLNLASYPKYISLDGVRYYHGRTYTKKKAVIAVLKDQMDRGWRQEAARMGEKIENLPPVRYTPTSGLRYANG